MTIGFFDTGLPLPGSMKSIPPSTTSRDYQITMDTDGLLPVGSSGMMVKIPDYRLS